MTSWSKRALSIRMAGKGCFVAKKNTELLREENLKRIEEHLQAVWELAASCGLTKEDIVNMLSVLKRRNRYEPICVGSQKSYKGLSGIYPGAPYPRFTFRLYYGLRGENGAGKTTTIKLCCRCCGEIVASVALLGEDCSSQTASVGIKEQIGVVLDEVGFPECLTAKQVNNILKHTYTAWEETHIFHISKNFPCPWINPLGSIPEG